MPAVLRPGPPPVGPGAPYSFPPVCRRGALTAVDLPGAPTAFAALVLDQGRLHEPAGREGLLNLLFTVVRAGSDRLGPEGLSFELEGLGANWSTTVGEDFSLVGVTAPTEVIGEAASLVFAATRAALPEAATVDRSRALQTAALTRNWSNPGRRGAEALARALYRSGRHAVLPGGSVASVGSVTAGLLAEYHRRHVSGGGRLVLAGDLTRIRGQELESLAAAGPGGAAPPPPPDPARPAGREFVVVDRPGARDVMLTVARHVPHTSSSAHVPLTAAVHVLGGPSSRLVRELRDRRGAVYAVDAGLRLSCDTGVLTVSTRTECGRVAEVIEVICRELELLRRGGVDDGELSAVRALLLGQFPTTFLTPRALGMAVAAAPVAGSAEEVLNRRYRALADLRKAEVDEAARRHLTSSDLTVVLEGPAAELAAVLHRAGPGHIRIDDQGVA